MPAGGGTIKAESVRLRRSTKPAVEDVPVRHNARVVGAHGRLEMKTGKN